MERSGQLNFDVRLPSVTKQCCSAYPRFSASRKTFVEDSDRSVEEQNTDWCMIMTQLFWKPAISNYFLLPLGLRNNEVQPNSIIKWNYKTLSKKNPTRLPYHPRSWTRCEYRQQAHRRSETPSTTASSLNPWTCICQLWDLLQTRNNEMRGIWTLLNYDCFLYACVQKGLCTGGLTCDTRPQSMMGVLISLIAELVLVKFLKVT